MLAVTTAWGPSLRAAEGQPERSPSDLTEKPGPAKTAPATAQEMVERLRTVPRLLPGWSVGAEPTIVAAAQLGTVLSAQDAAAVLAYQFQWAVRATLVPKSAAPRGAGVPPAEASPLTVDVLKFVDPLNAFGAFAKLRLESAVPLLLLRMSYTNGDQAAVWRGDFLVRITPAAAGPSVRPADASVRPVLTAAETVADLLPVPEQLPLMMRLMPEARLAPGTLRYFRHNPLGLPDIPELTPGDGLEGGYVEDNTRLRLVLLRATSNEGARQAYCAVNAVLAAGAVCTPLSKLGRQAQIITHPLYGLTYLMYEGRYVVLALGVHDRDTAEGLLRITATNIRILR